MKELHIKLSINELNLILESLGHQSYIKVYELIDSLQGQAKAQLNGSASAVAMSGEENQGDAKVAPAMNSN